jgi:hypothetical protein
MGIQAFFRQTAAGLAIFRLSGLLETMLPRSGGGVLPPNDAN